MITILFSDSSGWEANLRILDVEAVPSVPLVPWSHPFVGRLIGSLRREYLDHLFYWKVEVLEEKLEVHKGNVNADRVHQGLGGDTPEEKAGGSAAPVANLASDRWQSHCHGLVQPPIAA